MRYGTVVQYFPGKGFGFIHADSGPDVFFHVTSLGACQSPPPIEPGQAVKYELESRKEAESRRQQSGENSTRPAQPFQPRAKLVELIDRLPGAILDEAAEKRQTPRHPRAKRKKPGWRR